MLIWVKGAEVRGTSVSASSVKLSCIRMRDYKGQLLLTSAINRVLGYVRNVVCCVLSKKNETSPSLITNRDSTVRCTDQLKNEMPNNSPMRGHFSN